MDKYHGEQYIHISGGDTLKDLLDASSGSGSGLPLLVGTFVIKF